MGALLIGDQGKKESRQSLHDFKFGAVNQVLVVSYEQCRRNIDLLQDVEFGLLICDEACHLSLGLMKRFFSACLIALFGWLVDCLVICSDCGFGFVVDLIGTSIEESAEQDDAQCE